MAKSDEATNNDPSSVKKLGLAKAPSNRGFAGLGPNERREIASKGGVAVHLKGTGHKFTSEEARLAGQKRRKVAKE